MALESIENGYTEYQVRMLKTYQHTLYRYKRKAWDSYSIEGRKIKLSLVSILMLLPVAAVLSLRTLYIAPDDISYISHFNGLYYTPLNVWFDILVEEPLWRLYTTFSGMLITPGLALRVTIFLSSFGLLVYASRAGKGAWIFILLVFVLSFQLATQLYFNQIRQGVALTIFIVGLTYGFRTAILASALATMVHSGFVVVFVALGLVWASRKIKKWTTFLMLTLCVIVGSLAIVNQNLIEYAEYLGRRSELYRFENKLNIRFYILWVPVYGSAIWLMRKYMVSQSDVLLWRFVLTFLCIVFLMTFFYEAATRILSLSFLFIPLLIARGLPKKIPKLAAITWLAFIVAFNLYELSKGLYSIQTWFGRWGLILFGS